MDNSDIQKFLTKLTQLDIDASFAYEQALKQIDDPDIFRNIKKFHDDHLRHIEDLSILICQYGGTPPEKTKDFKGYLIEGFTAFLSVIGTKGALIAMESNEKLTNKKYREALEQKDNLPHNVESLIAKNYGDEKTHLEYITKTLQHLQ